MPFCITAYEDQDSYKFLRIDVLLPSGATARSVWYGVSRCGGWFILKYKIPMVFDTVKILDSHTDDNWRQHRNMTLQKQLGDSINAHLVARDKNPAFEFAVQRIKLPFKCERRLSTKHG